MANHVLPALCVLLTVGHFSAGNLVLNVKPDTISPGLTSDLTVNCSFTYSNQPNISSVMSLIITKAESHNSEPGSYSDVVSINAFTNHVIGKENTNAVASGNIDSNTLDAFLSLSWSSPSQAESGFYRCDANVLDDFGRPVDISTLAEVVSSKPDLDVLIRIVGKLQADLISQGQTIAALQRYNEDLQTKLDQQASDLEEAMYIKSETYNGRYYLASHLSISGIELAEYLCNRSRGYLVEIDDESERQFIANFTGSFGNTSYFITGATRDDQSGQWVFYHSGRPVTYHAWARGDPHSYNNYYKCSRIHSGNGEMSDMTCYGYRADPFLCEVPES